MLGATLLGACCCFIVIAAGCAAASAGAHQDKPAIFRGVAVRYQVADVDRAVDFYTRHLGFDVLDRPGPPFAMVANGDLKLWLSGPKSSGARPMPDGQRQAPGGWNRIVLQVDEIESRIELLKKAGVRFRNQLETGPGGKQIQLQDPDGNPVELFEPAG